MNILPKGTLVGSKYRIEALLGEGGLGAVYSATHETLASPVALKFLKSIEKLGPDVIARFLREAQTSAQLNSPHVARVFDVGMHEGAPYLVLERLFGEDMGDKLDRQRRLPIAEIAQILTQVCSALGEAHARGIIHRDIKAENIFLIKGSDGQPFAKLLDFGLASAGGIAGAGGLADAGLLVEGRALTNTLSSFGTPLYMAPEQFRSAKLADARSDIWALGVLMFLATTGGYPYIADNLAALCMQVATDRAPRVAARAPGVSPAWAALVDRCLEPRPEDRFPNVAALAAALGSFVMPLSGPLLPLALATADTDMNPATFLVATADTVMTTGRVSPAAHDPRTPTRAWPAIVLSAFGMAAVAAGGLWVAFGHTAATPSGTSTSTSEPQTSTTVPPLQPSALAPAAPTVTASVVPAPLATSVPTRAVAGAAVFGTAIAKKPVVAAGMTPTVRASATAVPGAPSIKLKAPIIDVSGTN